MRLALFYKNNQVFQGVSKEGISESFPMEESVHFTVQLNLHQNYLLRDILILLI